MKTKFMTAQLELTSFPLRFQISNLPPLNFLAFTRAHSQKFVKLASSQSSSAFSAFFPSLRPLSSFAANLQPNCAPLSTFKRLPSSSNHAQSRPVTLNFFEGYPLFITTIDPAIIKVLENDHSELQTLRDHNS